MKTMVEKFLMLFKDKERTGQILNAKRMAAIWVLLLGIGLHAQAAALISGPALDYKGDLFTVINNGGIETSSTYITYWGSPYQAPTWGAPATIYPYPHSAPNPYGYKVNTFKDWIILVGGGGIDWQNRSARYTAAAAYIQYEDSSTTTDNMTVFTVYGHDANPTVPDALSLTGYDPAETIPVFEGEQITGPSGIVYDHNSSQLVSVSSLPSVLGADADLSIFSGDTSWQVWVFETTMPFSEVAVPEPVTLTLLALGGLAMIRRRRMA
ncbi:MAG: PEP-CTERM sorting domain-containing protein [Phycisphaerae bacterium]|nr:PEP-CTERM sorting domain-containing protein [Phycisphaerae bacterium]